ncbi:AraC family transcriptional regulator [Roseimicrobium sp. ORNL1]|uniref:AraC family transcriptional regulator n=1 Tax=Roseimicrobium sp. ORNL1 TaxID=2711231 RepID=UPI001F101B93|nr:AraC family transcriptional regulator [Roseimicrobium sp. ORNL1]
MNAKSRSLLQSTSVPFGTDVTRNGRGTREMILEASSCPALGAHRISRVGIEWATPGFQRVRLRPSGSFLMAVCEGSGRILLDGTWQTIRAGTVCMAPPRSLNAFEAGSEGRWVIAWVRYDEPPPVHPLVGSASPQKVKLDGDMLRRAIEGLIGEWETARDSRQMYHWVEIVHGLARRIAQPAKVDEKLVSLWDEVAASLSDDWQLNSLAARFHSSREHLRKACLKHFGRSPMQQLTYMRMQQARHLLEETNDKLDAIAEAVGYESGLVLARAFRRWVGCSPTEYRRGL